MGLILKKAPADPVTRGWGVILRVVVNDGWRSEVKRSVVFDVGPLFQL